MSPTSNCGEKIRVALASEREREVIYRLRHRIYAVELGQHVENAAGRIIDPLDAFNVYLTASIAGRIVGFISITPPGGSGYSVDKYFSRAEMPFAFDDGLYEVRLLTVHPSHRGGPIASLLMYAAFRWIESRNGKRIVAIGRREIMDLYCKAGLQPLGLKTRSGKVSYQLMSAVLEELRAGMDRHRPVLGRLESIAEWELEFPFREEALCFHGGAFFDAIGPDFSDLDRRTGVINADVLDAWFPPSPKVLDALQKHLPWLSNTSPPTNCEGMIDTIAAVRGVPRECIVPGAGSSDLIFLALRHWLTPASRVLILDPTYGEYPHVLERVIGCRIERFLLSRGEDYQLDLGRLERALRGRFDLIVLVNPNSPTGRYVERSALIDFLQRLPVETRVWIDETYIEFVGAGQSLERFAAASENVVVCKSMSKVYALSGLRAAYLCGPARLIRALRSITPPWAVSLPAQVAAVKALQDPGYYAARYEETHRYRDGLARRLEALGVAVVPGVANFLLCHFPPDGADTPTIIEACKTHGLFLRDASNMGVRVADNAIRIAVKDAATNREIVEILQSVMTNPGEKSRNICKARNGVVGTAP